MTINNKITFVDHIIDIITNGKLDEDYTYAHNYAHSNFILKSLNRSTTESIKEFNDTFELNCYKELFITRANLYRGNVFIKIKKEDKNKLIKAYNNAILSIKSKLKNDNAIKAKKEEELYWWP